MRRLLLVLAVAALMVVLMAVPLAIAQDEGFVVEESDPNFIVIEGPFDSGDFDNFDFVDLDGSFTQGFEQEDVQSGNIEAEVDISNTGDNANICAAILQSANTGNIQNQQGVSQFLAYSAYSDDIEFEGSEIEISSELAQECEQSIQQTAVAAAPAPAPAAPAAPAPAAAPAAPAPTAAAPAPTAAAPAPAPAPAPALAPAPAPTPAPAPAPTPAKAKALPPTGGISPLLLAVGAAGVVLLLGGGLLVRRNIR